MVIAVLAHLHMQDWLPALKHCEIAVLYCSPPCASLLFRSCHAESSGFFTAGQKRLISDPIPQAGKG